MISDLPPGHPVQFELINPLEQKVDNQVQKAGGSNLLVFATKTEADAVTGNYRAVFRIGGATFTKRVRIETVKPNRLKIKLKFSCRDPWRIGPCHQRHPERKMAKRISRKKPEIIRRISSETYKD